MILYKIGITHDPQMSQRVNKQALHAVALLAAGYGHQFQLLVGLPYIAVGIGRP